jgi:probable phosphoglycerate mutase
MIRYILVRHGETVENAAGICQGHLDGRLSEKGRQENRELAKRLRGEKIDLCYSSPLSRAKETGEEILKHHPVALQTDPRLAERDMGILTGRHFPDDYNPMGNYPQMESLDHMAGRLRSFLAECTGKPGGQSVLLITHGITLVVLLRVLNRLGLENLERETIPRNSSVTILEKEDASGFNHYL